MTHPKWYVKCPVCEVKYHRNLKTEYKLHVDACYEQKEQKRQEAKDNAAIVLTEYTYVGFTDQQARFLAEKFGEI